MTEGNKTAVGTDLLASVIGAIDVGLIVLGPDSRLVLANPWVCKLAPDLADATAKGTTEASAAKSLFGEANDRLADRDHRLADRWIRTRRRETPDGGVIVVLTDITSEKHAEDLLVDARDSALLADRAKSEFLANMTHELRTPLNAVIGFAEVLRDELYGPLGNPQYHDFVADIYDSGRHLLAVIDDILDLSKIEVGRRELRLQPMDVARTIDSAVRMLVHRAEAGGVSIESDCEENLPLLNGEERGVKQIILNLLTNSVKFTPRDGKVFISAALREGLDITVSDTGVGIAPEDQERVFTPFVQLDAGGLQRYEGAGLGLALVKSLSEMHRATVTIDSAVGKGTRIAVHFPESALIDRGRA